MWADWFDMIVELFNYEYSAWLDKRVNQSHDNKTNLWVYNSIRIEVVAFRLVWLLCNSVWLELLWYSQSCTKNISMLISADCLLGVLQSNNSNYSNARVLVILGSCIRDKRVHFTFSEHPTENNAATNLIIPGIWFTFQPFAPSRAQMRNWRTAQIKFEMLII